MRLFTSVFALSAIASSAAHAANLTEENLPLNSHYDADSKTLTILDKSILVDKFKVTQNGYTYTTTSDEVTTEYQVTKVADAVNKTVYEKRVDDGIETISEFDIHIDLFKGANPHTTDELAMMTDNAKFEFVSHIDLSGNEIAVAELKSSGCTTNPKGLVKVNGEFDFSKQANEIKDVWGNLSTGFVNAHVSKDNLSTFDINLSTTPKDIGIKIDYTPICKTISSEYIKQKEQGAATMFIGMGGGILARNAPTLSQGVFGMMPLVSSILNQPSESASYNFNISKDTLKKEIEAVVQGMSSSVSVNINASLDGVSTTETDNLSNINTVNRELSTTQTSNK